MTMDIFCTSRNSTFNPLTGSFPLVTQAQEYLTSSILSSNVALSFTQYLNGASGNK